MKTDKTFLTLPATKSFFQAWLKPILAAVNQGQSVRLVHLPYCGGTGLVRYFLEMPGTVFSNWAKKSKNLVFLWHDLAIDQDLYQSLKDKKGWDYKKVKKLIKDLTWRKKKRVIIFVSQSEDLLQKPGKVQELYSLLRINPMFVHFVFRTGAEIDELRAKKKLGYLYSSFSQNTVYLPLYEAQDLPHIIKNQRYWYKIKVLPQEEKLILKIWGGWAPIARVLLRRLNSQQKEKTLDWLKNWSKAKVTKEILADKEISFYFDSLWESFTLKTQDFLINFLLGKIKKKQVVNQIPVYLSKTNCVLPEPKSSLGVKFSSPWLKVYLGQKTYTLYPQIVQKKDQLWFNDRSLDEFLTTQEMAVFQLLWRNKNEVVDRDQIAKALWAEAWADKYSDWAIDKVIARIRKKLGDTGTRRLIQVVKGRGLILKTSTR